MMDMNTNEEQTFAFWSHWSLLAITAKLAYTTAIECLCDFGKATDMRYPSVFSPVSFQKMATRSSS